MKHWLRRKLHAFLYPEEECNAISISLEEDTVGMPDPLSLKLQKANGGYVIEIRHYQRKNDERYISVHVVPEEQNLQEAIAKILTYESLKK